MTNTTIIVDLSYFIFYRYYATITWYKMNQGVKELDDLMADGLFLEKYTKFFKDTVKKIVRLYGRGNIELIFAQDCPQGTIWRRTECEEYKATRTSMRDRANVKFDGEIFPFTLQKVLPDVIKEYSAKLIAVPCVEADDIVAVIVKQMRMRRAVAPEAQTVMNNNIIIITNDDDYLQLTSREDDTVKLYNLQGKNLYDRAIFATGEMNLLYKIIIGDKSDNIPGIAKKIGKKRANDLTTNPESLEKLLLKDESVKTQFAHNKRMIDFESIPENLKAEIVKKFNTLGALESA